MTFIPLADFSRRIEHSSGEALPERVNYACGINARDGWLNLDYFDGSLLWQFRETGIPRNLSDRVLNIDLLQPHPFPDGSFAFAHCEDFIEHIDQKSAILFLAEIFRTLRPGGILRLSAPGLEGVLSDHFTGRTSIECREEAVEAFDQWGHVHFFCHASLEAIARAVGFEDYQALSFGVSDHPELQNLETRPEQYLLNIYAEMRKSFC